MKKLAGIIAVAMVTVLFGCGQANRVHIADIKLSKSVTYTGASAQDTIMVFADEKANGLIMAGEGDDTISFIVRPESMPQTLEMLEKLKAWGATAKNEAIATEKLVGRVNSKMGKLSGTSILQVKFISGLNGENWNGILDFCYIGTKLLGSQRRKSNSCDKRIQVFLPPESVDNLIASLKKVPEYSEKVGKSNSKGVQ